MQCQRAHGVLATGRQAARLVYFSCCPVRCKSCATHLSAQGAAALPTQTAGTPQPWPRQTRCWRQPGTPARHNITDQVNSHRRSACCCTTCPTTWSAFMQHGPIRFNTTSLQSAAFACCPTHAGMHAGTNAQTHSQTYLCQCRSHALIQRMAAADATSQVSSQPPQRHRSLAAEQRSTQHRPATTATAAA